MHASMPPLVPGVVIEGRYRVEQVLSANPANDGYLATDLLRQHSVFLKTIPIPELLYRVEQLRQIFQDASLVSVLQRGDFVPILGFGVDPQLPGLFLVMAHRTNVPPQALLIPGGPEMRTAAAFSEVALDLLRTQDRYNPPVMQAPPPLSRGQRRRRAALRTPSQVEREGWRTRFTFREFALMALVVFGLVVVVTSATEDRQVFEEAVDHLPSWMLHREQRGPVSTREELPAVSAGGLITIDSIPTGAQVTAGARDLGRTPVRMARPESDMSVTVSMEGYNSKEVPIGPQARSTVRVSLVASIRSRRDLDDEDPRRRRFEGRDEAELPGAGFETGLPGWTSPEEEERRDRRR